MTSYLIDINVWLALMWEGHPHARIGEAWIMSIPEQQVRFLFCRVTQMGLMRLLANRTIMGEDVLNMGQVVKAVDRWYEDPRVSFAHEPPGVEAGLRSCLAAFARSAATKLIMDAYLVAFAQLTGSALVTLDRGLANLAHSRSCKCVLLPNG